MRSSSPHRLPWILATIGFAAVTPVAAQDAPTCPAGSPAADEAILDGSVLDRETAVPLQQVEVTMYWLPIGQTKSATKKTETDRRGRFRFCDAPAGVTLTVRVDATEARSSESVRLTPAEQRDIVLHAAAAHSVVSGRIVDHATNRPVATATIDLGFDALRTTTAQDGVFTFQRVPPGFYVVRVQHVGFLEVTDSIQVDFLARLNVTVRLAPDVIPIDPIEVVVRSRVLEIRGFYDRMDRGIGTFLTRQQVQDMHAMRGSDILRRVAGIQLIQRGAFGPIAVGRGSCPFRYVIDGTRLAAAYSMDDMPPQWIEGIEIYMGPSQAPIEFAGFGSDPNGNCGVIVIWTRNRG